MGLLHLPCTAGKSLHQALPAAEWATHPRQTADNSELIQGGLHMHGTHANSKSRRC